MEKEKKEKKQEIEETIVVKEFPSQKVNKVDGEDGKIYNLVTVEDALTEILNIVKKIEKLIA